MSVADYVGIGICVLVFLGVVAWFRLLLWHSSRAYAWHAEEIRRIKRGDHWRGVDLIPRPQHRDVTKESECRRSAD